MDAELVSAGKQTAVRLPPDLILAAEKAQEERDQTLAQLIRYALRKFLRDEGFLANGDVEKTRAKSERGQ